MRQITSHVVGKFVERKHAHLDNTKSIGGVLYLFGYAIAEWRGKDLYITAAGWKTNTTKERLNGLPGVNIYQKDFEWYLNGKVWDGSWAKVGD
jgi:hypothetical protein